MRVPLLDLQAQYRSLRNEIRAEFDEIAEAQTFVLGPKVARFEEAVASRLGLLAESAIGVSSGTDAQLVLLMAMGIGPGDAVALPAYTFFATAGCVARLGARPVFVDIEPDTYNLSPAALERALESHPDIRAIIAVHLYGCCADMLAIKAIAATKGIPVLEDAAQALGAEHPDGPAGALGHGAWFSFYPTKNLGAFGDAGMAICPDPALAAKTRALRNHGMEVRYYHRWIGGNFRLDAIQAAVLKVKLPHLDRWSEARRKGAALYRAAFERCGLAGRLGLPVEPWGASGRTNHHIYHQFVIRAPDRDGLRAFLQERGIGTEIYYPLPLHLQECFVSLGYREGDLPVSERAAKNSLALPIYPELDPEQIAFVAESVGAFYG
jgi:dTDP-4-amino-4,6-dideoxygalactose transaminase